MRKYISLLFFTLFVPFISASAATIEPTVPSNTIEGVGWQYYYTLDDNAYIVKFQKKSKKNGVEKNQRTLYAVTEKDGGTQMTKRGKITGGVYKKKRQNDSLFTFKDNLYMTVTRGLGKTALVYRSENNGNDWEKVEEIGYAQSHFRNQIKDIQTINGQLYIIVGQHESLRNKRQTVGVWSTKNGKDWVSKKLILEDQSGNTRYTFENSLHDENSLFIITTLDRHADENSNSTEQLDQEDIGVFSTTNGTEWNTQRVTSEYDAHYDEVNYLGADGKLIDGTLFINPAIQPLQFDEETGWYKLIDESVIEDGDDIILNTYQYGTLWATNADTPGHYLTMDDVSVAKYNNQLYAFSPDSEGIVNSYTLSYTAENGLTKTVVNTTDLGKNYGLQFMTLSGYPALVENYQENYTIALFKNNTWKKIGSIPQSNNDAVETYTIFDKTYFYSLKEQQLYTVNSDGKLQETTFGFTNLLSDELKKHDVRYTVVESPKSNMVMIMTSVYEGSKDTESVCVVADRSLEWESIDCTPSQEKYSKYQIVHSLRYAAVQKEKHWYGLFTNTLYKITLN